MDELSELIELCRKLGAPPKQAEAMASQILKRVGQLIIERKLTRKGAMSYVLQLVTQGRSGEVPKAFEPPANRPPG